MCCLVGMLYLVFPQCIGCHQEAECCCFEQKMIGCKPVKGNDKLCCICTDGSCNCIPPTTCMKGTSQCFCCDVRCAFPCDADVPCIMNVCGLTCCYSWNVVCKCCAPIKDIVAAKGGA